MSDSQTPGRRRRRLAAILMADIAGFSRLMGRDEEGTTSRVIEFHERVRRAVEAHGGRVVATAGDSVFGDFDSVVDAVDCAVVIQGELHEANEGAAADERIEARIGLHLGDVIVEEYNVFGDGVNIAARLEQIADPGGIVLSEAVYQQVRGKVDWPITEMGTHTLKNIDEPIRLFRIGREVFDADGETAEAPTDPPAPRDDPRAQAKQAIRDLVTASIQESVGTDKSIEGTAQEDGRVEVVLRVPRARGWPALFSTAVLVTGAIGALLISAKFTGWTDTGWYPFFGFMFAGLAVGMAIEGASGRSGLQLLMQGIGLGAGAWFVPGTVMRAILWVVAAAVLGAGLQQIARPRRKARSRGR